MPATTTSARHAALESLIDHAALFPPASLPMADAVAEDIRVRAEPTGWIVNRFVVAASQLSDLPDEPARLSVVYDVPAALDDPRIEAVEIPSQPSARMHGTAPEIYVELPAAGELRSQIASLAANGQRAKVRCGGAAVPTVERLASFVRLCREHRVPFKATAGLHHAVRVEGEHGFLNLLAAATFGEEEAVLGDTDAASFGLDDDAFRWRDRMAGVAEVARIRRELFVSFGSCSVQEPVDDLATLGMLPA